MSNDRNESSADGGSVVLPETEVSKTERVREAVEGTAWRAMVRAVARLRQEGIVITKMTVRGEWSGYVDILIIVCADTDEGPIVAFHGAENVSTMWERLARRMDSGGLKWRRDDDR